MKTVFIKYKLLSFLFISFVLLLTSCSASNTLFKSKGSFDFGTRRSPRDNQFIQNGGFKGKSNNLAQTNSQPQILNSSPADQIHILNNNNKTLNPPANLNNGQHNNLNTNEMISENNDQTNNGSNPNIVEQIKSYLKEKNITPISFSELDNVRLIHNVINTTIDIIIDPSAASAEENDPNDIDDSDDNEINDSILEEFAHEKFLIEDGDISNNFTNESTMPDLKDVPETPDTLKNLDANKKNFDTLESSK